jgi:hypothetical protein
MYSLEPKSIPMCVVTLEGDPLLPADRISELLLFHGLETEDVGIVVSESSPPIGHLSLLDPVHGDCVRQANEFLYEWMDMYF